MRRITPALLVTGALVLGACGGDDEPAAEPAEEPAAEPTDEPAAEPTEEPADEPPAQPAAEPAAEPAAGPAGDGGPRTATLTLDNGETFEFGILCMLEPQVAAGSEILFTAVSYDDPGLDITQFGDEGTVTGIASVSVYDGSYETLWEANSFYEAFGGSIELSVDGSTIRGEGDFFEAGDPAVNPEPVSGTVEARCG